MRPPPKTAVSAVILAGGRGARLGGKDKATLTTAEGTLLVQLCESLQRQCAEVIVVRRRARGPLRLPRGVKRAWDRAGTAGPVAGLEAGLRRASRRWCLTVPVDCVQPPSDLLARLARAGGGYAQVEDDAYYLHSLLLQRRHRELLRFLHGGGRSAANACRTLNSRPVRIDRAMHSIWSINTREDRRRARLQRR